MKDSTPCGADLASSLQTVLRGVQTNLRGEVTMRRGFYGLLAGRGLAVALLLGAGAAQASTFDVNLTVSDTSLSGGPAVLVFDFLDGGPPDINTVTLSALTSKGILLHPDPVVIPFGGITGTGPWTFSDLGSPELQLTLSPLGASVTFSFTITDYPAVLPSSPDGFSLFIGSDPFTPLITTDAPLDQNVLFLYSIGNGAQSLSVFTPDQPGFLFSVTPAEPAPEPASLALLAAGLAALLARRGLML
jgi:hypothetical protein